MRKWRTFTPGQHAALWLLRDCGGRGSFGGGVRKFAWWVEGDRLRMVGPVVVEQALAARGLVRRDGDRLSLTADGVAQAERLASVMPGYVARCARQPDMALLSEEQMAEVSAWFPKSHGVSRHDDRLVLSGIVSVLRAGLRWNETPAAYGSPRRIWRRFRQWGRMGVLDRVFAALMEPDGRGGLRLMVDGAVLSAHSSGRLGARAGWFPSLLDSDEVPA